MATIHQDLVLSLSTLAHQPGVYQFYDKNQDLLYVGKAKNLKKRVNSYFTKKQTGKTQVLVRKIHSLETIIVNTEFDALLLENNLIKKHQPRYNIQLKDDKTYPWICIKNERFPRIFLTRNRIKDGSAYFGPYANVKMANTLLDLIKEIYPLRSCKYNLSEANIESNKFKTCLEYHIQNCLGPCEALQTEEEYNQNIVLAKKIVKGKFSENLNFLRTEMQQFAAETKFEQAQKFKEKIELLEKYQVKSTVVNPNINNVDVFTLLNNEQNTIYYNFLKISNGSIIQSYTSDLKKKLEESDEQIMQNIIVDIREKFQSTSKEIYLAFPVNIDIPGITLTVPKIGDKKAIVDLSLRNVKYYRIDQLKKIKITDPEKHTERIMQEMKTLLHLSEAPTHIEGFDNSNLQGTHPVSACVVFKNGKPSKRDYRHFNIKTVEGPDDFASMEEVVYRRYKRLLEEKQALPQLIIIDGGKGQLSSAVKSLERLNLRGKIAILGIAKRLEEIFFPDDPIPLYLDKRSETLRIIQQIRNESHRFGISHHRKRRSKTHIQSELDSIKGIGPSTKTVLLSHFKSVKRIKEASQKEIEKEIGTHKGQLLWLYFNP